MVDFDTHGWEILRVLPVQKGKHRECLAKCLRCGKKYTVRFQNIRQGKSKCCKTCCRIGIRHQNVKSKEGIMEEIKEMGVNQTAAKYEVSPQYISRIKQSSKHRAIFWKYTGNHDSGVNHIVEDTHDLGLELIGFLAYCKDNEEYLSKEELSEVGVRHSKGDSFGHKVVVSAPPEIWHQAKSKLEQLDLL